MARQARTKLIVKGYTTVIFPIVILAATFLSADAAPANVKQVEAAAHAALSKLPGQSAVLFTALDGDKVKPLVGIHQDERFAVGSSFKLFILGKLASEVNADRRGLDNVMRLRADLKGPPASDMGDWPVGSPVTLHSLALKMISISDNTATDHLLYLLGRENVERQMALMGHSHSEWNRPLLSTREMAMLRDKKTGMLGNEYLKLNEAGRRKFLAERIGAAPDYDQLDFDMSAYSVAEWYATPLDMARALTWLKNHTQTNESASALRGILAVDAKLPHDAKRWPYVGFKGGSEDQILAGNWLLENRDGRWYTFHVYVNNPQGKVDPKKFFVAVGETLAAVEKMLP